MTHRFFRADEATYEQVRLALNSAWGLPNAIGTVTCIVPVDSAPRDDDGRVLVAVRQEFTSFTVAVDMLPQLLAAGLVEEIDQAAYMAVMSRMD